MIIDIEWQSKVSEMNGLKE